MIIIRFIPTTQKKYTGTRWGPQKESITSSGVPVGDSPASVSYGRRTGITVTASAKIWGLGYAGI